MAASMAGAAARRPLMCLLAALALVAVACSSDADEDPPLRVALVRSVPATTGNVPFDEELERAGFRIGKDVVYVQDDPDLETLVTPDEVTAAVTDWVAEGIDLIVAFSSSGAEAAATAAPDTPVLFLVNDPVAVGLVSDKARPDRNLTGATFRVPSDRTLDLARQAVPELSVLGILVPANDPAGVPSRDSMVAAAGAVQLTTHVETFADEADIERAVGALADRGVDAIAVVNAPTSVRFITKIEPAASARGVPIIANTSLAARALLVLEPNVESLLRRLGRQAARLLGGTAPSDVPVEDPTEFRVVLNSTVAAELGLPDFSGDLLRQADQVLE